VQISNSVGAPTGSHADPANSSGPLASQILTGAGRTQQPAPGKSAAESAVPADPANPITRQNGVPRPDSADQRVGRRTSSLARREARYTNQPPDSTVNGAPAAGTNQDTQPAQFLAILGDVQDTQAGVVKAQTTASYVLSQLPGTPFGASYAAPISTVTNTDAKLPAAANPADSGNPQENTASPNATQQAATRTIDALLETDPAVVTQVGNESRAAASTEVAFAARITFKAADQKVIAPNERQAAIAASRFEGLAANGGSGKTQDNLEAAESGVLAQPAESVVVAASQFEAMASDSGSGEPQRHAQPNASAATNSPSPQSDRVDQNLPAAQTPGSVNQSAMPQAQATASQANAVQPAAGRSQGSPSNSGAIVAKTAAAGLVGSSASANPQNASSAAVAATPSGSDAASGRSSTNVKPAPQDHTAQYGEVQNEPAERAAEAVRDISLNLSTKDQNVQVRLSERAGELHVTVRTPDSTLSHGLREGLSDLMGRLERGGYRAETWQPGGSDPRDRGQESSRRGFSQQQNAGGKGSGRQQDSQDSESESETPKWIGELESSFQEE
jgi:hypothetical protein